MLELAKRQLLLHALVSNNAAKYLVCTCSRVAHHVDIGVDQPTLKRLLLSTRRLLCTT